MKRKFHIFDENNEGIITKNEIANLLSSLGEDFTPDVVANILKQAEVGDFYVDFHEFSKTIDPGNNELRFQFGKTQNERISVDPVSKNYGYSKLDLANKKKTRFSG